MTAETYWQRFHEATKEPTECDVLLHSDSSPGQELNLSLPEPRRRETNSRRTVGQLVSWERSWSQAEALRVWRSQEVAMPNL